MDFLINKKINIQIRSIFLQGLILEKSKNWPSFASKVFLSHHKNFNSFLFENNRSTFSSFVVWAMCRIMQRPEDTKTLGSLTMLIFQSSGSNFLYLVSASDFPQ